MLVMYSILKILPGLKLTFLLLIFGVGGSYILEHRSLSGDLLVQKPIRYIQPAEPVPVRSAEKIPPVNRNISSGHPQGNLKVNSLSDLRLHIQL